MSIHLQEIMFRAPSGVDASSFPFRVPTIAGLVGQTLAFKAPLTFFVGENGSGKSTLLEAIALAARIIAVGSEDVDADRSLDAVRHLAASLRLSWSRRTHRGFFLRAEDFFGYARRMQALRAALEADLAAVQNDTSLSDRARSFGSMPFARSLAEIKARYGEGLDSISHGESFFTLFRSRMVPDGLYLLDEPEAPLSPLRQIGLLALFKELIEEQRAQLIVATHSPILMAYPGATILSFDDGVVRPVTYNDLEHVTLTRDFLANPQRFLRHL
jgi:predicted ATPase